MSIRKSEKKDISFICPVYNGEEFIDSFFNGFQNISIPANCTIELLIVNNGSSDNSKKKLEKAKNKIESFEVKILDFFEKQSSYASRNFGVDNSKGSHLAFIDIDCIIATDYLEIIDQYLNQNSADIISGNVRLFTSDRPNIYEIYDLMFGFNMESYRKERTGITANLVVSRSCFNYLNGFAEYVSGADRNFCKKAIKKNFEFIYLDNLLVNHPARNSFKELKKKTVRIAEGKLEYLKNYSFSMKLFIRAKNIVGSIIQTHQIKTLLINKQRIKELRFIDRIKLITLVFYLGIIGRIKISLG